MANLLSYKETFFWEDSLCDRGEHIEELNSALVKARELKDDVFVVPDFFDIQLSWGDFFEYIYSTPFDEVKQTRFPWLSQTQHQTLIAISSSFQRSTANSSRDLDQLNIEFPKQNNSLIGFYIETLKNEYVFDENTWENLHKNWVTKFKRNERLQQRDYFRKFFVPDLQVDPNQINALIKKGQTHQVFKRLDKPKVGAGGKVLHGEQVQMHFNDKKASALNLDGTWKHGGFSIPEVACEQLVDWGFLLPEDINV